MCIACWQVPACLDWHSGADMAEREHTVAERAMVSIYEH